MKFTVLLIIISITTNVVLSVADGFDEDMELIDRPIQLVKPDIEHKKLVINEQSIKMLQRIRSDLATVAVVGKYHTGKSFLMNQLMQKSKGFGIGPYVTPETMGIWMWGNPIEMTLKSGKTLSVIFLDTEGFAATNVTENYDAKIFAVATLMSSFLIYNSVKIIDQADIDYLELLSRRTQLFALKSQMSSAKWTNNFNRDLLNFPPLLWVVQDFVQATVNNETPKDWIHRLMTTHVRENEDYVISLLDIFPSIDCQTLFLPAVRRVLLMDLSLANNEDLTDEYKEEVSELKRKLRDGIVPKEKNSKALNGPELASLLRILVQAANDGSLSQVPSRWLIFVERLERTATEDCLKFYEDEMSTIFNISETNPVIPESLIEQHKKASNDSLKLLQHLLLGLNKSLITAEEVLSEKLTLNFDRTQSINVKNIKLFCSEQVNRIENVAENEMQSIKLPISSTELIQKFQALISSKVSDLKSKLNPYISKSSLDKHLQNCQNTLKSKEVDALYRNNQLIEEKLTKSSENAIKTFKTVAKNNQEIALTEQSINRLHSISSEQVLRLFGEHASFAREEKAFTIYLGNLKNRLAEEANLLRSENEEILDKLLKEEVIKLTKLYEQNTGDDRIHLPLKDEELVSKLKMEERRFVAKFKDDWQYFTDFLPFSSNLVSLKKSISLAENERKEENVKAFAKEVKIPLNMAKQTILLSIDHFDTVFKTKQYIERVCLVHLNEGKPKLWPDDLKHRIIEDFVKEDVELRKAIESKTGFWSNVVGLLQWLWWLLTEAMYTY